MTEDKPAVYIMRNVDGRVWFWEGTNDRMEEHMFEAMSKESLEKAIVAIRAQLSEVIETRSSKSTKLLIQPGLLEELGLTVKDVANMIRSSKPIKLLIQPGLLNELGLTVKDVVKMIEGHHPCPMASLPGL
jgi:hypothetical protein